jgi:hypothetical protein
VQCLMSLNEPEKPKKGCSCFQLGVMMGVLVLLLGVMYAGWVSIIYVKRDQMRAGSDARQLVGLLLTYAADYNGQFPDAKLNPESLTANVAFRELFKEELIRDEFIFGCPYSTFIPDKNIGTAPDYKQALEPGENHWMMVAGLTTASPPNTPLLLENSVDVSWPPRWHLAKSAFSHWLNHTFSFSPPARGRSWSDNTILVTKMNGSLETVKLVEKDGFLYLPDSILKPEGKEPLSNMKLLDVEEKPITTK